jgi:hypothetical protein
VNEVYLTPAATQAFQEIHLWKSLQGTLPPGPGSRLPEFFAKADRASKILRVELLRFRKRPFGELLRDWSTRPFVWATGMFRGKADPKVRPAPRP